MRINSPLPLMELDGREGCCLSSEDFRLGVGTQPVLQ